MTTLNDHFFDDEFERRSSERSPSNRGAFLRIPGINDLFLFTVRDASDRGIGMRLHFNLPLLSIDFDMSEDGFRMIRRCRLIWRDSCFAGAEFIDRPRQA
jgi:hypothetical protein